jgi:uncharacterized membrane protein YeaQ/YmgE (transglycosylase-associated protein family)
VPFWLVMVVLAEGLIVAAASLGIAPERDAMTVPATVAYGLVGALLGGVIAWTFVNSFTGVLFAAIGASALVYTRRRFLEVD